MNFDLDETQRLVQSTARAFLRAHCTREVVRALEASATGHSPELWQKMAELGWTGMFVPQEYGGAGMSLLEVAILFEEVGRAAFDSPLFATTFATLVLLEGGSAEQKSGLLPRVAAGEAVLTVAVAEEEAAYEPAAVRLAAQREPGDYRLDGTKLFVPYATVADWILVAARTSGRAGEAEGVTLFAVDPKAAGVACKKLRTIAPDKQFEVRFRHTAVPESAVVGAVGDGLAVLRPALARALAFQCAEMVGNAAHELEVTAEYVKNRVQFGRPLATFQAVQHHLANMFADVEGARWTTYQAVAWLARGLPAARELAIARAFTSEACQRVAFLAQQLHGGIGVDLNYDLHFYYRRAKALELRFGPAPIHLGSIEPG